MKNQKISREIKEEILEKIKNEGLSVKETADNYGISTRTIYKWLGSDTEGPSYAEVSKLKKENKALLELVGAMTMKLNESQKKR